MLVHNLQQRCIELVGLSQAEYHHFWTKWITAIDRTKGSSVSFTGDFFDDATVELAPGPRLILFAASTGAQGYPIRTAPKPDWRYFYEYHEVFLLRPDGALERTGLVTHADKRWVLAMRDQVALLLNSITQAYGAATPLQLAIDHLNQRALAVRLGHPVTWTQADLDMLMILVTAVEKQPVESGDARPVENIPKLI